MKRVFLFALAAVISLSTVQAQTKVSIDKEGILKKIEKSDAEIANPKKAVKASTWINRGKVFIAADNEVTKSIYDGIDVTTANLMFGKPKSEQVTIGRSEFTKLTYPHFVAYADAKGIINAWQVTTIIVPDALDKALEAYQKAQELDPVKSADAIKEGLVNIVNALLKQGDNAYMLQEYTTAAINYGKVVDISSLPYYGARYKEASYSAGVANYFSGNYHESIKRYMEAIELGDERDGEVYYMMYHAYRGLAENDPSVMAEAEKYLATGLGKFPEHTGIIECMTDLYVNQGKDAADIIPIVTSAIDKDPKNPALWNGLGRIYDRLGDFEKSIGAFSKVAELVPDNFSAHYSVGLLYLKRGDKMGQELNIKPYNGKEEYDADLSKIMEVYSMAIPPLEKAYELNPDEVSTVELLKNVTFRLRDQDGMMDKYNKYNEILKAKKQ